jgi:outer membrane lipoprotein-sorting protein
MPKVRNLVVCIAVLALPLLALGPVRSAQGQTKWNLDGIIRQLDKQAKDFHSLKADIERTKVTVVVNDKSTESGEIFVRKDDKMRIDFTQPDPREILRLGNELYLYNPKIKRVEEYDLARHKTLVDQFLLLGLGSSGTELSRGFLVTFQGEEQLDKRNTLKLELTPKMEEVRNQVSKIDLWIDEANWLPAQQQFFEAGSGDYLLIRYTSVIRNPGLSDTEFKQRWPKGVTRVKPEG